MAKQVTVKDQAQGQECEQEQEQELELEQYEGDLNLASENELASAKMRMNVVFEQNLLKPGSPGYAHDVRKDFDQPKEDCGWDDDSS